MSKKVRASGVVVWREASGATNSGATNSGAKEKKSGSKKKRAPAIELLVIHRPRYDDWSFAKGKLDPGETDEECADRELFEETGFRVERTDELTPVTYVDHKGRPKLVRYWVGELGDGTFEPNDEVDRIEWLAPDVARDKLSYDHDRGLVDETLAALFS